MIEAAMPIANSLGSRYQTSWLAHEKVSLALTTYQTGKLFFVGRLEDQGISVFELTFNRCMGCWASSHARTSWMCSQYQLWQFEYALPHQGYGCLYVPRAAFTTGDLDIHDLAVEESGRRRRLRGGHVVQAARKILTLPVS